LEERDQSSLEGEGEGVTGDDLRRIKTGRRGGRERVISFSFSFDSTRNGSKDSRLRVEVRWGEGGNKEELQRYDKREGRRSSSPASLEPEAHSSSGLQPILSLSQILLG